MFLLISILLSLNFIFLWILLIVNKKSQTEKERFIEDNMQMEYLRKFILQKKKILL